MKDVKIKTTSIPAKPRSKNYPAGAVITRTTGGVAVNGGGGGGASVDIVKATDTKSFTDSNVLSSLRTLLEIRSRIIAESDTATEFTDDNTFSSLRTLKEIDAAIKEALKKIDDLYLSKVKADIAKEPITFLKGLFTGDGLAFINASGDAELQSLVVRMKAKAATLEVTGSANVGTLHSEGNISTGADIWAKGDTHTLNLLVQALAKTYDLNVEHVATLFQTIVKDFIGSERFIPGLMGEGMKLYKAINGDWNLEIDNAVVRKAMTIFELIISKVRAVNGGLVISSANGRVKSVSETSGDPAYYVLGIEGDMMFVADDLVRCQVYTSGHVKYYWVPVASVNDDSILILKSVFPNSTVPAVGDDLVQMGNLTNPNRQGILYLTASEDGKPRISVLDGVNSTFLAGKNKVILGCLDGMTDTDFPADLQPSGYGLYAMNCFLKGIFILRNGKSIEQEFANIATELSTIPGKIELAIRSMKVADVNLLYDSNHKLNANPYQMGAYKYDIHLEVGKTYTLTVCYKCVDSDVIRAYNNPSYGWIGSLPKSAEETVLSQPITPINPDGAYFYFYKFPQQESTGTYIKWAVITEGSVGVANWIPSATERKLNIGGENLMLQSQQALDGSSAQYTFQLSKAWTDLKGKTLTISFDYAYSNLKMGSSQRFGLEKAIYKSGTSQYYYIGAFKYVDSTSPTTDKGRYVHTIKVPDDIEDSLDTDITAYIQLGGSTVCRINNFQIEIGDTATGWKPAPKDSFTESKKYTDTQILAVDGKIELSVKTKVENLGIGANNLYSYTSTALEHLNSPNITIERQVSLHGFYLVGKNPSSAGDSGMRIMHVIPPIPGKYTVSGWIKGSQSTSVGFTIDVCDSESYTVRSTADNQWSYFKHTFDVTRNTEAQSATYHFVDLESISWAYIWVKDFKVEAGEIATAWSPNFQDAVYKGAEYTNSQISVVEGKITSTVEKINTVDGRVTGLASRVEQTEKSITSVVGDISVINSTTNRHISKRIDLRGWDNNKFFPLVISIPVYHKTRVEISRPLDAGYGKPSYGTHDGGFSMNLTFEMSGSGWGSLPAVTNIFDYTKAWTSAGAKIVVDLGQITETSTCRMGIRGGSMYDVTVDDTIDPNVINVYQTDYHGSYNTSFPVRTDGTEPVRTYGYYTEIKQTQESIALTANKVDDQGRRLSAAELTLSSDHAKLSVVEQTANSANSLAGTANNKANTVDGRVTATQNGLVETGINITSRKIVLKSDNVLFQNNAGQQTAAINTNGKLSANVIEAAEVVAQAFSAQRITTGNLTVTDGAIIGGMTISGGKLKGGSIELSDGAVIGGFRISGSDMTTGNMRIAPKNIRFTGGGISAGLGIDTAPSVLGLSVPLWIQNESRLDTCIAARLSAKGAYDKANNIALALDGCISGFAIKLRSITESTTLGLDDCFVSCSFSGSDKRVYLPKDPPVGKVYLIKRWPGTGRGPIVHANGSTLNGGATEDLLKNDNHLAICVWGGKSWSYNKISL